LKPVKKSRPYAKLISAITILCSYARSTVKSSSPARLQNKKVLFQLTIALSQLKVAWRQPKVILEQLKMMLKQLTMLLPQNKAVP